MTITTALILLIVTIVGVGVALAGVIIPANNRHGRDIAGLRQEINQEITGLRQEMNQQGQQINQDITGLRQEINQQAQQITQIAHQVGHLSGLLEGLRGRPIATEQPEEIRVG